MISSFTGQYRFLSNFHPAEIEFNGWLWPTTEHAYQAAKMTKHTSITKILGAPTPGKAKRLGRDLKDIRADWDSVKLNIMMALTKLKFHTHDDLKELLLATGDQEIVEGNYWGDRFWGVCNGEGENHLGKIIMEVRNTLKKSA